MALQQQRKNYVRTRVLLHDEDPDRILGYYALTPCQVDSEHMPVAKRLSRRIGGILLARLAVSRAAQGIGYGEILLADAIATTRASIAGVGGMVKRAVWLEAVVETFEQSLAEDRITDLGAYAQAINSLLGLYRQLGLERRPKNARTLAEVMRGDTA
jgi:GNAT superfamily N-acetyltransferase